MHHAALDGRADCIRALLEYLLTFNLVNRHNDSGYTLLHVMCLYGRTAIAADLALALDAGADPHAIDLFGHTPLQLLETRNARDDAPQALIDLLRARAAAAS